MCLSPLHGEDTLSYQADSIHYGLKEARIELHGNGRLSHGSVHLFAEQIHYNLETEILKAYGTPVLIDSGDTLYGEYIEYHIRENRGRIGQARFSDIQDSALYRGDEMARDSTGTIYISGGRYTTSFTRPPQYTLFSPQFKLIPDEKALARPVVLEVQRSPVVSLPFFIYPLDDDRRSGWLTPRWGVGIAGTGYVDNIGYYWGENPYIDFTMAGRINDFEHYQLRGETRYHLRNRLRGNLSADMSFDDYYGGSSQRWSLSYEHSQHFLPDHSLSLRGSGELVSDNRYYSDYFRDTTDFLRQTTRSQLTLQKRMHRLSGHTSASWERREDFYRQERTQTLPHLRFSTGNYPLLPFLEESSLTWSYSAQGLSRTTEIYREEEEEETTEAGIHHTLPVQGQLTLFNNLHASPVLRYSNQPFHHTGTPQPWCKKIHS
ncbi:LPS-assembly protein LptD [Chitinivibrio alkaliphilus]|uniref:LPS-assembly protein LptD central domain-containing protein n=1 Tax=Chitinivibrio alkaliphilus ACht1 TaxID=1313304 RepID=U7DBB0_9BACT|nr:putative LPS assembly protein LptD [Chitinivibrio alkaliphilus]ERP31710.1 hypothetical protein CALK_1372 [Chitinivibrio alkaliphilus ACht1]